jgi:murein DD-endopeptidase MepM/ murein hydrolase activator NlpD
LNVLHKQYINTILIIAGVVIILGFVAAIVIIRTPKIEKIGAISDDIIYIKKGVVDLFTIARINKTTDSIRDINYQHLPKYLPIPAESMTKVSSIFGRRGDKFHIGTDYATKEGTPIYASAAGIITKAQFDIGYGNMVEIDSGNKITTRYAHMKKITVIKGQKINQGEIIGTVGSTGISTGNHLHFEIIVGDKNINPAIFMQL